ncbi:ABC transporter ATP-binding protein [Actinocatenispora rupis]|uniref:Multidrug ABC transporter permease n=1 Tax=Actinocatenispora rupis TaxID=519421 RepID=A0A8J3IZW2_9ACTN|nr:ABC transporter ATP-binding protein [Actinocatenispora rupis]GID11648.1 multidrug ABC transporter permease [Actinocatenispora rupis]
MRTLPLADPGIPVHRTPAAYLRWVARKQGGAIAAAMGFGVLWMLAQALMPAAIGKAIDEGLGHRDATALLDWSAVLLGLGAVQAAAGVMRHRLAVSNWLTAAYRTVQVVTRHSARLGATLPKRVATGEVVTVGGTDIAQIGNTVEIAGRLAGSVVSFVTVAVILLATSVPLGLLVLIGVPVLVLAIGPVLRPLHHRQRAQRELAGDLTTYANDIVHGLRVLRGVGGEDVFATRYAERSQRVRAAGYRVAGVESTLDAAQILLPGIFVVLVTWLGARFALDGTISAGQLVAFYGYAAFLVTPLSTGTEAADKITRGLVAARRVVHILGITPELADPADPVPVPGGPCEVELADPDSGVRVAGGSLTVLVVSGRLSGADLADRLGRYVDGPVLFRGVPLARLPLAEVRRRILVSDTGSRLFAGTLRTELDPSGELPDERIHAALAAASGTDILVGMPDGLDTAVEERGRSVSGGQQQRLVLARALLADPDVLVLVEPTSAVDAHTEARIAANLGTARAGRTTVVVTASPLLAAHADTVLFVRDGHVAGAGAHTDLLADPAYRGVVLRGDDDGDQPAPPDRPVPAAAGAGDGPNRAEAAE